MADEKAGELLKDKSFLEELDKTQSVADAQRLFAFRGADISMEELSAFLAEARQKMSAEIGDEDLALVAGGAPSQAGLDRAGSSDVSIGGSSVQLMFSKLQLSLAEVSKSKAMGYIQDLKKTQEEQKFIAAKLQYARQMYADVWKYGPVISRK
jgi:hypothetical protein